MAKSSTHGDDPGFGFTIPSSWPRWKKQCTAHKRSSPDVQCKKWAVRGMSTCYRHGSGGVVHQKLGLIKYLSWVIIGCPQDTPAAYAKFAALSAALEMMFNQGMGTPEQKLRAAMFLMDAPQPPSGGQLQQGEHERNTLDVRDVVQTDQE